MNDHLPPLPPYAPEFKPRWPNDPGGYTSDQMQAYARAAIEKDRERHSVPNGWKLVPIEPSDEWIARLESQQTGALEAVDADAIRQCIAELLAAAPQPQPVQQLELTEYDAGLLNDFGGGNVEWWQDYIRAELGRAFEHYQSQVPAQGEKQ